MATLGHPFRPFCFTPLHGSFQIQTPGHPGHPGQLSIICILVYIFPTLPQEMKVTILDIFLKINTKIAVFDKKKLILNDYY